MKKLSETWKQKKTPVVGENRHSHSVSGVSMKVTTTGTKRLGRVAIAYSSRPNVQVGRQESNEVSLADGEGSIARSCVVQEFSSSFAIDFDPDVIDAVDSLEAEAYGQESKSASTIIPRSSGVVYSSHNAKTPSRNGKGKAVSTIAGKRKIVRSGGAGKLATRKPSLFDSVQESSLCESLSPSHSPRDKKRKSDRDPCAERNKLTPLKASSSTATNSVSSPQTVNKVSPFSRGRVRAGSLTLPNRATQAGAETCADRSEPAKGTEGYCIEIETDVSPVLILVSDSVNCSANAASSTLTSKVDTSLLVVKPQQSRADGKELESHSRLHVKGSRDSRVCQHPASKLVTTVQSDMLKVGADHANKMSRKIGRSKDVLKPGLSTSENVGEAHSADEKNASRRKPNAEFTKLKADQTLKNKENSASNNKSASLSSVSVVSSSSVLISNYEQNQRLVPLAAFAPSAETENEILGPLKTAGHLSRKTGNPPSMVESSSTEMLSAGSSMQFQAPPSAVLAGSASEAGSSVDKGAAWELVEDNLLLSSWGLPSPVLEAYHGSGITAMFLWQAQCLATGSVLSGGNLVYSAPTSAGKTMVAELLMLKRVLETRRKALFILPFVSVTREKMISLQRLFQDAGVRVGGFMGSHSPAGGFQSVDVAVCTIEKGNSLVNRLMEENRISELGLVVIDELHMVGDSNRGYLLELLLTKICYMDRKCRERSGDSIQLIGMSATLPNLDLLASWLHADLYHTEFRPVPLTEHIKVGTTIYDKFMTKVRDIEVKASFQGDEDHIIPLCLETLMGGHSILIFCPTKAWCEKMAEKVAREFYGLLKNPSGLAAYTGKTGFVKASEMVQLPIDQASLQHVLEQLGRSAVGLDPLLGKVIQYGVAYHHAGLTFDERDIVEGAFRRSQLKVLVATSTLSSGVNLPARRVIVRSPMFGGKVMDVLSYRQMAGRAGRKGVDTEGECVLVCKEGEKKIAQNLLKMDLPPVTSCLSGGQGEDNAQLSRSMKRAILEVVVGGMASTPSDVAKYVACTLLSASLPEGNESMPRLIQACLAYLEENEFVRLTVGKDAENREMQKYQPTQLGSAVLASSMSPDEGLAVFVELQKARQCFVLANELHVIYLVTPIYSQEISGNLDWYHFYCMWEKLSPDMRLVAKTVGVEESFLTKAITGRVPTKTEAQSRLVAVHRRFYTALALHELVQEVPLLQVAARYNCNKGQLQSLMQSAATFAGMVTVFCARLGWANMELLFAQFQQRLTMGVTRELCDLVRIPLLTGNMARNLFNAGYQTVAAVAHASPLDVETVFRKASPFQSNKKQDGDSDWDMDQRRKARCVWLAGRKDVTELEAALAIIEEAKEIVQQELGVRIDWQSSGAPHTALAAVDTSSVEDRGDLSASRTLLKRDKDVTVLPARSPEDRNPVAPDGASPSCLGAVASGLKRKSGEGAETRSATSPQRRSMPCKSATRRASCATVRRAHCAGTMKSPPSGDRVRRSPVSGGSVSYSRSPKDRSFFGQVVVSPPASIVRSAAVKPAGVSWIRKAPCPSAIENSSGGVAVERSKGTECVEKSYEPSRSTGNFEASRSTESLSSRSTENHEASRSNESLEANRTKNHEASCTKYHEASRSTTKNHEASRTKNHEVNRTKNHEASRSTKTHEASKTENHEASRTKIHEASRSTESLEASRTKNHDTSRTQNHEASRSTERLEASRTKNHEASRTQNREASSSESIEAITSAENHKAHTMTESLEAGTENHEASMSAESLEAGTENHEASMSAENNKADKKCTVTERPRGVSTCVFMSTPKANHQRGRGGVQLFSSRTHSADDCSQPKQALAPTTSCGEDSEGNNLGSTRVVPEDLDDCFNDSLIINTQTDNLINGRLSASNSISDKSFEDATAASTPCEPVLSWRKTGACGFKNPEHKPVAVRANCPTDHREYLKAERSRKSTLDACVSSAVRSSSKREELEVIETFNDKKCTGNSTVLALLGEKLSVHDVNVIVSQQAWSGDQANVIVSQQAQSGDQANVIVSQQAQSGDQAKPALPVDDFLTEDLFCSAFEPVSMPQQQGLTALTYKKSKEMENQHTGKQSVEQTASSWNSKTPEVVFDSEALASSAAVTNIMADNSYSASDSSADLIPASNYERLACVDEGMMDSYVGGSRQYKSMADNSGLDTGLLVCQDREPEERGEVSFVKQADKPLTTSGKRNIPIEANDSFNSTFLGSSMRMSQLCRVGTCPQARQSVMAEAASVTDADGFSSSFTVSMMEKAFDEDSFCETVPALQASRVMPTVGKVVSKAGYKNLYAVSSKTASKSNTITSADGKVRSSVKDSSPDQSAQPGSQTGEGRRKRNSSTGPSSGATDSATTTPQNNSDCVPPTPPDEKSTSGLQSPSLRRTPMRACRAKEEQSRSHHKGRNKSRSENGRPPSRGTNSVAKSSVSKKHLRSPSSLHCNHAEASDAVGSHDPDTSANFESPLPDPGWPPRLGTADNEAQPAQLAAPPGTWLPDLDSPPPSQDSLCVVDVCSNTELFQTFVAEWSGQQVYAISAACEKKASPQLAGGGIGSNFIQGKCTTPYLPAAHLGIAIPGDEERVIVGLAVSWADRDAYYISFLPDGADPHASLDDTIAAPPCTQSISLAERTGTVTHVLSRTADRRVSNTVVAFDCKAVYTTLARSVGAVFGHCKDPLIANWLLDPGAREKTLHSMVTNYLPQDLPLLEGVGGSVGYGSLGLTVGNSGTGRLRAVTESIVVQRLMVELGTRLLGVGLEAAFTRTEMPSILTLARMELNGFGFSHAECESQKNLMMAKLASLEQEAYTLAGHPFSLTSTDDVSQVLYLELQLPLNGDPGAGKPTRTLGPSRRISRGRHKSVFSTSKDILEKLKGYHPLPAVILEWRRISSALTKHVYPLQKLKVHSDRLGMDRIYGEWQTHTATGRVSMTEPNLQNIPRDFEIALPDLIGESPPALHTAANSHSKGGHSRLQALRGKTPQIAHLRNPAVAMHMSVSMRHAFVPFPGGVIVAADYSQLELRVIAHLSGDHKLISILNNDGDVFKMIAAQWKSTLPELVSAEERQLAKQICYGMLYGIGAKALGEQIGVAENDAAAFMESFKAKYTGMRTYLRKTVEQCRENGYVTTVTGRRRYLPAIKDTNPHARAQAERQAVNTTVQGSAADIVKAAMNRIDEDLMAVFPNTKFPHRHYSAVCRHPQGAFLVLQLHDELVYEVSAAHLTRVAEIIKRCMETTTPLNVHLPVKVRVGPSWGRLEETAV